MATVTRARPFSNRQRIDAVIAGVISRKIFCPNPCPAPAAAGRVSRCGVFHRKAQRPGCRSLTGPTTHPGCGPPARSRHRVASADYTANWPGPPAAACSPGAAACTVSVTRLPHSGGPHPPGTTFRHRIIGVSPGGGGGVPGQFPAPYPALALSVQRPAAAAPASRLCRWCPRRSARSAVRLRCWVSTARWCMASRAAAMASVCRCPWRRPARRTTAVSSSPSRHTPGQKPRHFQPAVGFQGFPRLVQLNNRLSSGEHERATPYTPGPAAVPPGKPTGRRSTRQQAGKRTGHQKIRLPGRAQQQAARCAACN